jgi:hypothetical protein
LPEEDEQASELHETEEVLRIELPADEQAAAPLNPGEKAFDQLAPLIAAKVPTALSERFTRFERCGAIISMPSWRNSSSRASLS